MSVFGKISSMFGKSADADVTVLASPLTGRLLTLSDVPDEVFSGKVLGDGFAIDPSAGVVVAPCDAEVTQLFRTHHAVGLAGPGGLEILIHIGIDTVKLAGEGFKPRVSNGQKVKAGDVLIEFDVETVRSRAKSLITPVVFTNMEQVASFETTIPSGNVSRGQPVLKVRKKS